jgi:Na+-translocating ferredoxin:NAD+ oxidoreductase RnfD subunit
MAVETRTQEAPASAAGPPVARRSSLPRWLAGLGPKHLITILITAILIVAEGWYGAVGGWHKLILTLGTCVAVEAGLSLFLLGRWPALQSAYVTGVSLTILLRPASGLEWPFVVGAALSIGSKYVLRYRGRHLWNPSNLGIALLLFLAPNQVAILSHEFGNAISGNAVIWVLGLLIASRAKILHVSLTYVVSFVLLGLLRSAITGYSVEAQLGPLTGPMYQLMVFFMLTDPRTTVSAKRGRMITVALIAVAEAAIRLGNDFDMTWARPFAYAPPILALAILGPIALAIDLKRRAAVPVPVPASANAGFGHKAAR